MTVDTAPSREVGYTSLANVAGPWGSILDDALELIPDLTWPLSVRTFSRMRFDPTLASVVASYTMPLRRAAWHVDADGCRPEVAKLVADDVGLPIAGQTPAPSPARRRGVSWAEHARVAVGHLIFGHMPFEQTVEIRGGQARLDGLSERLPQTIESIETTDRGDLKAMLQYPAIAGKSQPIPATQLVWYVHEREGAHWQGRSMLRPAYAAWLLKNEMQRVHGVSNRRFGMGVPGLEVAPGTQPTPAQMLEAQRLASKIKVSDTGGYAAPPGFQLVLKGITGSVPDTLGFIRYLDQQMARMALASVLDLGDTQNGSRALGQTFLDLFLLSLQAIADEMASVATAQIAVRLVDWNFGEDEPAPRIVCGDVGSDHAVTALAINQLVTAGAITPDPALDAFLRSAYKIPPRDPNAPVPAEPTPPKGGEVPASRPSPRRVAAASPVLRRQPTAVEAAAKTDFPAVQGDWQSALDKLVTAWAAITVAQRKQLTDQIKAAVDDGDVAKLATLAVDSKKAAALLETHMTDLAAQARDQAASEATAQGVSVDVADAVVNVSRVSGAAEAAAAFLAAGLATSAGRKALQVWAPDSTADDVASQVDEWLASLTDASLRDGLGAGLSVAQGEGRAALFDAAPQATYYASEILDANVCGPCADIDGSAFDTWDDASAAYASGGFVDCEGGLRCRGVLIALWDAASVAQDEAA